MKISKMKDHFKKVLVLGSCLFVLSATAAMAAEDTTVSYDVQTQVEANDEVLSAKHREIDSYFAGEGKKEMEELGFSWTHTGPMNNVIEIGITPYEESFAEFLYEKFGREFVQVVEGQQAVTFMATDDLPASDHERAANAENGYTTLSTDTVTPDASGEMATTMSPEQDEKEAGSLLVYYLIGGVVVLGALAALLRKPFAKK